MGFAIFAASVGSLALFAWIWMQDKHKNTRRRNRRLTKREINKRKGLPVRMGMTCGAGWIE